jgi:hypothetical protein
MSGPTIKVQTWGDDLRLPCFINLAETTGLLSELEPLRRSSNPFQSKHLPALKRNTWFVLRRPVERSGLLVVWPAKQCCVYISGEPTSPKRPYPRIALLRIRVDPQFLNAEAGLTVFAATLRSSTRTLSIEDTLLWKGRSVFNDELFSARWALAVQWIEHYCILDPRLLGGIDIEIANWGSLDSLQPEHVWELQADETGRNRLLWIANYADTPTITSPEPSTLAQALASSGPSGCYSSQALASSGPPGCFSSQAPTLETGPLIANAMRDSGPEQWVLSTGDGSPLGKALIRTLSVSERLRSSKSPKLRVEVAWNPNFSKWEIKAVSESLATVSIANFEAAK